MDGTPLLKRWRSLGMIKAPDAKRERLNAVGGTQFDFNIRKAKLDSRGTTSPRAIVPTAPTNTLERGSITFGMYFSGYSIDIGEMDANNSKEKIIDVMKDKIMEGKDNLIDIMAAGVHAKGTDTDGITGLPAAVCNSTNAATIGVSATYANIARATSTWFVSTVDIDTTNYTATNLSSTMTGGVSYSLPYRMKKMWGNCNQHRADGKPTLIVTSQAFADIYEEWALSKGSLNMSTSMGPTVEGIARADKQTVDLGFEPFTYKGAPILVDPYCPTNDMYFLNENRIWLQSTGSKELRTTALKEAPNQIMTKVAQFYWRGNLVLTEPRTCGVIIGDSTTLNY